MPSPLFHKVPISIHAPHARSDCSACVSGRADGHFNPRSSCEERPNTDVKDTFITNNFNPRSSCEERPSRIHIGSGMRHYFNPRSSCEERRCRRNPPLHCPHFNPRSSCEERLQFVS